MIVSRTKKINFLSFGHQMGGTHEFFFETISGIHVIQVFLKKFRMLEHGWPASLFPNLKKKIEVFVISVPAT